jgi:hypothetical protein
MAASIGTSPWVQSSSGGYQIISTSATRTGSYSAWLGGYNYGTDAILPTITVPSTNADLLQVHDDSGVRSTSYDYLRVRLLTAADQYSRRYGRSATPAVRERGGRTASAWQLRRPDGARPVLHHHR